MADFTEETEVPNWMTAADNHNLGNSGGSWFDPDTWSTQLSNIGKFAAASVVSGVNSFYTTGVTIANWFGANAEAENTSSWIHALDDDMGKYYDNNREAVDLAGFIGASLIPGMAGVKILNAGQNALKAASAGMVGSNLSRATGLLVPRTEWYIQAAADDIIKSATTFSKINQNTIAALSAGVWQNTLEAAAFETAVQVTMAKSPVLADESITDVLKNIAIGGAVGGVIGGAFAAAKTFSAIDAKVIPRQRALKEYSSIEQSMEGLPESSKIILMNEQRMAAMAPTTDTANADVAGRLFKDRDSRFANIIRTGFRALTGSDNNLGNFIADALDRIPNSQMLQNLLHVEEIGRLGKSLKVERELADAAKELGVLPDNLQVGYVRLHGDNAGQLSFDTPPLHTLADTFDSVKAINDKVASYGFKQKELWDPLKLPAGSGHLEAEARYMWADRLKVWDEDTVIHVNDVPMWEAANRLGVTKVKIKDDEGLYEITGSRTIFNGMVEAKNNVANELLLKRSLQGKIPVETSWESIPRIVNASEKWLSGERAADINKDIFLHQANTESIHQGLIAKGLRSDNSPATDSRYIPSMAKIGFRMKDIYDVDGHLVDGMVAIKQQQTALQMLADNVFAKNAKGLQDGFVPLSDTDVLNASIKGAGPSLLGFAQGGYGSLASLIQQIGKSSGALRQAFRKEASDGLESSAIGLLGKQEAAIEFSSINREISNTSELYVLDRTGEINGAVGLVPKKVMDALGQAKQAAQKAGTEFNIADFEFNSGTLQAGAREFIPFANPETELAFTTHVDQGNRYTTVKREINSVYGKTDNTNLDIVRPIRPNPKDYQHFVLVKDDRVTGAGHMSMIHAASAQELEGLIRKVPPEYTVLTKAKTEDFFKARGEYEYDRTLNENYINESLHTNGVNSTFFVPTDPKKIANDFLQHHLRRADSNAVELVRMKYQRQFDWLEDQGRIYSEVESSKYGGSLARTERLSNNPFTSYIKTALDITQVKDNALLTNANRLLDKAVSDVVVKVRDQWDRIKSPRDLDSINEILQKYGSNTAYYDSALEALANHTAPKGELTKFVRGANAVLSKLTLGLDPLNAINNAVGANVLRGAELSQLTKAIQNGNTEVAGKLAEISKITLPGVSDQITAPTKLVASAIRNYFSDLMTEGRPLISRYRSEGLVKDYSEQFASILNDFSLRGTETVAELQRRLNSGFQKAKSLTERGEFVTGNKFAEDFNRFVSADVMRQITDVAEGAGILDSASSRAYRNTFVNRVEGNITASQRPLMFQGPIGQAVGLFQSYQFNLMQNLFRYVGEGTAKDTAMLLGLQGTFYGLQGTPGFNFINQHIVGTASGNPNHTDLYSATYGIAGKTAGDFLVYGLPSNLLQTNLYSRGDINPRQVTVIPTNIADVPFVGAMGKFFGSIKDTVSKIGAGAGVWESILQGIEHNGISRPLAGLAQTTQAFGPGGQAYSTTSRGTILGSNDFFSIATASRLAGGKPIDEAIINDAVYRISAYQAADRQRKNVLMGAIKASSIQGETASESQISQFATAYASLGGKQGQFNRYMMDAYKSANTSQAQKILSQLNSPFTQRIQTLMGGEE